VTTSSDSTKPSVDQIAAAGLVAKTAAVADLAVADDASNAAITMNIKAELAQQDVSVITKPQTFQPSDSSAIVTYKTVAGDTVPVVAAKYSVSPETLRWANNLTTDTLVAGADMVVPTVDGVVYVIKAGDSIDAIAQKYGADKARIISRNSLELSGLVAGQRIVLPGGVLPQNERPGYVAPRRAVVSTGFAVSQGNPLYTAQAGNRYTYGTCTWYAYNRRAQIGRPIGSFWGNASSWAYAASAAGFGVSQGHPGVGDVMQNGGGYGHVAVVEEVRVDGSIVVSEMNFYSNGGGWNRISYRTLDAGAASSYRFIK
jgi:surface antigen